MFSINYTTPTWIIPKEIRAFKDWQIIYCVAIHAGKTAAELSVLLGVSKSEDLSYHPIL
jgi:hypothetical protein